MLNATSLAEYVSPQFMRLEAIADAKYVKSDIDCAIEEITESISHLDNGIMLLSLHLDKARSVDERVYRLRDSLSKLIRAKKDLEGVGVDIENEA